MRRVLILGGGFGGIATAVAVRARLDPVDEVVLVERRPTFVMGLRKNWALLDATALAEGERRLADLERRGITVTQGTVEAIDPNGRAAVVDGERIEADALVVALGAERDPDRVPGFRQHAINLYDRDDSARGREAIAALADGGRVVIGIFAAPYPCPPAPFELALLLRERFEARNVSAGISVFSPLPLSLPIIGRAGCGVFELQLEFSGIEFLRERQATAVGPRSVTFADGSELGFDLLLGVAPHRVPAVVAASGLTAGAPWVKVDARTLETSFPGVYAIGDVTGIPLPNGQMLPKAGAFAHAEGDVVAERIADRLAGREPTATFAAEGTCFLETGGGAASMVAGRFFEDPPAVVLTDPAPEHLDAKRAFEADRLAAWFGG
jgi:sulfide:quinone oxidoreductase